MPAVTRPVLPPLQTSKAASFPSEIVDTPISCVSAVIKQENASLKTPITPPVAYTEFLKSLTPVLASPPPSALQRSMSDESTSTRFSMISNASTSSSLSSRSESHKSPSSSVPPTPYSRRTPTALRRLRIPHSPAFSPSTCGPSPRTAVSGVSTGGVYSPFSPADWSCESATRRFFEAPRSACTKPVSVRSVVTRTVTYKRSPPLEPAPKGKKRKVEAAEMPPPPTPSRDTTIIKASDFPSTLIDSPSVITTSPSSLTTTPPTAVTSPPTAVA